MLSKSAKYYRDNPEARKKKNEYQKKFNKKREQVVNRVGLNKENRERGTYGNGDGLDVSHMSNGKTRLEPQSKNRGNKTRTKGDKASRGGKSNMKCNVPRSSTREGKKKMVKACSEGTEKLIHYGADGYKSNYSDKARKSFRARHKCDTANDKLSARYWACKDLWSKNSKKYL